MDFSEIGNNRQETGGRKGANEYGMIKIMIKITIMIYEIRDVKRETGGSWGESGLESEQLG